MTPSERTPRSLEAFPGSIATHEVQALAVCRPGSWPARGAGRRSAQQAHLPGPGCGLGAVGGAELAVDVVEVGLDRAERDEEVAGDLGIRTPGGQESEDL